MTLTISLPSEADSKLQERARAAGQEVAQYVEQLVARDIGQPVPPAPDGCSMDDQYQHGYTMIPEEVDDVVALIPHLAIESEVSVVR